MIHASSMHGNFDASQKVTKQRWRHFGWATTRFNTRKGRSKFRAQILKRRRKVFEITPSWWFEMFGGHIWMQELHVHPRLPTSNKEAQFLLNHQDCMVWTRALVIWTSHHDIWLDKVVTKFPITWRTTTAARRGEMWSKLLTKFDMAHRASPYCMGCHVGGRHLEPWSAVVPDPNNIAIGKYGRHLLCVHNPHSLCILYGIHTLSTFSVGSGSGFMVSR